MPQRNIDRRRSSVRLALSSSGVTNLMNQIMFFLLCDRIFCPQQKLTGLYSLLFYNVLSYMISYAKEVFSLTAYSPIVVITEESNLGHLAMTATKLVLDITKAITFVITGVFMLLLFGIPSQTHYSPTYGYIFVTLSYYCLTERVTNDEKVSDLLTFFRFEALESLEILWTPVLIRIMTSFSSGKQTIHTFHQIIDQTIDQDHFKSPIQIININEFKS